MQLLPLGRHRARSSSTSWISRWSKTSSRWSSRSSRGRSRLVRSWGASSTVLALEQRQRWARHFVLRMLINWSYAAHRRRWTTSFSRCMELCHGCQSDGDVQPHANRLQTSYHGPARRPGWREGCSRHGGEFGRCALLFHTHPFLFFQPG